MRQGRASNQWFYLLWSPPLVAYCTWRGLQGAVRHSFTPGSWSAWIAPVQALLLLLDDVLVGTTRVARMASHFTLLVLLLYLTLMYSPWKVAGNIQLQSWLFQNPWGSHWWHWHEYWQCMAYLISSIWLWFPRICLLGWLSLYTSWQCWVTWSEWMEVWYP